MNKIGWCDECNKDDFCKYVAGFFDGEGSFMILTIYRKSLKRFPFRLRPKISIAQKEYDILEKIKLKLGYGFIQDEKKSFYKYIITSINEINQFIEDVGPYIIHKNKQLFLFKKYLSYLSNKRCMPYEKKDLTKMIEIRDNIHELNQTTRKLKYTKNDILDNYWFDKVLWNKERKENLIRITNKYIKKHLPKELIIELYINKQLSRRKIGCLLNVHHTTISRRIMEYGL